MSGLTVAQALALARARGVERLDAQLLLARALGMPRAWLLAHDDAIVPDQPAAGYRAALARRADGEPLAYIVGEKEFRGLSLTVSADVLVPRPDTETLVEWAIALLHGALAGIDTPRVIDLGTGSGAIALAIKQACPAADVAAVDASRQALVVAQTNADKLGLPLRLLRGDWWSAVAGQRFHLAVSNPPYVAQGDPHLAALGHEPREALASGADGLDAIRRIVGDAASHLEPGGWLLLEHGHDQADAVRQLLAQAGFTELQSRADLAGIARCSGGRVR